MEWKYSNQSYDNTMPEIDDTDWLLLPWWGRQAFNGKVCAFYFPVWFCDDSAYIWFAILTCDYLCEV